MRIVYALALLLAVTLANAGDSAVSATPAPAASALSAEQACLDAAAKSGAPGQLAQSGCCKGNKGVCGCRAGKIVCCDKTFDASCTCNRDEPLTTL